MVNGYYSFWSSKAACGQLKSCWEISDFVYSQNKSSIKMHEGTELSAMKKLSCSVGGFKNNKEEILINHFNHCKDVDNPAGRWDADANTLKSEDCNGKTQSQFVLDEHLIKCEPIEQELDIKSEEIDFSDTVITGLNSTISEEPIKHLKTEVLEELFKCSICDYEAAQTTQLKAHMKVHKVKKRHRDMEKKSFQCTLCNSACTRRSHRTKDMRTQSLEKRFKCAVCDYTCTANYLLTVHMRSHTGEKPFKCSICVYATTRRSNLTEHMRTHTGEKRFKCSVCGQSVRQHFQLTEHMRTHTREKPFKCTLCDYACAHSCSFTTHLRTHTREKQFKCSECDYTTTRHLRLTEHMRTHMCDYAGRRNYGRRNYIRTHTGDRHFKCIVCGPASTQESCTTNLTQQMTSEEIKFKCSKCDCGSTFLDNIQQHMRTQLKMLLQKEDSSKK